MSLTMLSKIGQDLPVSQLALMPEALRRRWLKDFLERNGVREPERSHIVLVESIVFSNNPSARVDLPGNVTIERCYDRLQKAPAQQVPLPAVISLNGITELPRWGIRITCREAEGGFQTAGNVVIRSRQPGDEMRLSGGTKSLKKLFIDKKIPASQRPFVPVLADEEGVLSVYGLADNLDRISREGPGVQILIENI